MANGLGPDSSLCTAAFIDAMRTQMTAANPADPSIQNLDLPEVRKNFAPFGEAVYRIATERARAVNDPASDAAFFQWIVEVQTHLSALAEWQAGLRAAFQSWAPADPSAQTFRLAVIGLADPGSPPKAVPSALEGRIE